MASPAGLRAPAAPAPAARLSPNSARLHWRSVRAGHESWPRAPGSSTRTLPGPAPHCKATRRSYAALRLGRRDPATEPALRVRHSSLPRSDGPGSGFGAAAATSGCQCNACDLPVNMIIMIYDGLSPSRHGGTATSHESVKFSVTRRRIIILHAGLAALSLILQGYRL